MAFRIATFALDDRGERTPSGGLKVKARIARTGIQVYHRPDGSEVKELRPEEEVFSEDALASFRGAPVTDLHPSNAVTPENWTDLAKGHVADEVTRDGDYVGSYLYIQDGDLIRDVQEGRRKELSGGYQVEIDETPGEWNGERYDRIQRNIRGNHVATLPPGYGRAGPEVAIRLDSKDNAVYETQASEGRERTEKKMIIKVDGIDYPVEGSGAESLRQALDLREETRSKDLNALKAKLDETSGRADAAEKESSELKAKVKELEDPAHLDSAAQIRAQLILDARTILENPETDFTGKSAVEIMGEALGEEIRKDASEDYLRGAFHVALKSAKAKAETETEEKTDLDDLHRNVDKTTKTEHGDPIDKIDSDFSKRNREAWRKQLAVSRDN